MSDPRIIGKQTSGQVQERNFASKGVTFNNRPGLLGAGPQRPYDVALKGLNDETERYDHIMPIQTNRSLYVDVSPTPQSLKFRGNSGTSFSQKSPLLPTPSPKTPDKCSNSHNIRARAGTEKNFRSVGASGSKLHNDSKGKTSIPSHQDKLSVSNKQLPSSGLINNPYGKALQILNKSAEKCREQLGSVGKGQDAKTDRGNVVKSNTSLSKPKSVLSTVSDRETLERELNRPLIKDLKEKQALVKALNKPLDLNLKQKEALARELNKSLERDLNDNVTKTGKRKVLDDDKGVTEKKRIKYDKTDNSGGKSRPQAKKSESKTAKRKSSEILKRDSELLDSTDRRKVKKGSADDKVSRNVVLKTTPVKFGTNSTFSEDLKIQASVNLSQQKAPSSSRSFTRQDSEDSNPSLELPKDQDQSGILRQFIGDKDKLLSIQSWIDNIRDGAASSIASGDTLSECGGDADDKRVVSDKSTDCDSGYLSPPVKQPVKTVKTARGKNYNGHTFSRERDHIIVIKACFPTCMSRTRLRWRLMILSPGFNTF